MRKSTSMSNKMPNKTNRTLKPLSFHNIKDADLIEKANSLINFNETMKKLLRKHKPKPEELK